MEITIKRVNVSEIRTTTTKNNFNRNNYVNRNEKGDPYGPPQNREAAPKDGGGNMKRVEDVLQKMRRGFDATDENTKGLRGKISSMYKRWMHTQSR